MSCTQTEIHLGFGAMYCLHLHNRKVSQAATSLFAAMSCWLLGLITNLEDKGTAFLLKPQQISMGVHGMVCQKVVNFIVTAVRTSNPTFSFLFGVYLVNLYIM
jgi:hypothetical protein